MSTPIEGGRPLLRVRVLGFPVHLDLSFVIIMAVLGYYPGVTLRDMALWLVITPVAVLVHELGQLGSGQPFRTTELPSVLHQTTSLNSDIY